MPLRVFLAALSVALVLSLTGCEANPTLASITVTPATGTLTEVGQTVQFTATGTYVHGNHPVTTRDITSEAQWSSSIASVATINNTGVATAAVTGTTTITASMNGSEGVVTGTATLNVSTSGGTGHDLLSLSIIPPAKTQVLNNPEETAQFLAIGTFNSIPTTMDMTNQVTWESSDVDVATINSTGLATAGLVSFGETTITAVATSASGATITGISDLTVNTNGGGGQLPALAVYAVGLGIGTVTSDPVGISCQPAGGAGCTGHFPLNTVVTLKAVANSGSQVGSGGGWSSNCTPVLPIDPTLQMSSCTITMSSNAAGEPANEAVGVIFNPNP